ncbi:hypothetical protein NE237_018566 [Protea cynaroides]|uniref:Uncharacterized protein n=1 Tax=Protea cynaroides TaxID=273540 RepID=A0A9Q0QP42_9MAGN|nr:hypothetical protein NE237_018566 [Protea cynaroides]
MNILFHWKTRVANVLAHELAKQDVDRASISTQSQPLCNLFCFFQSYLLLGYICSTLVLFLPQNQCLSKIKSKGPSLDRHKPNVTTSYGCLKFLTRISIQCTSYHSLELFCNAYLILPIAKRKNTQDSTRKYTHSYI